MKRVCLSLAATLTVSAAPVLASDIRVAPVTIETLPGVRTSSLTVINEEDRPVQVQFRVLRWSQVDGRETLTPTTDVVVSPPQAVLEPDQHHLIRVVRTAQSAPAGEEAYRIIVDEVPDPSQASPGSVNLVLRQEIPAFFSDEPRRTSVVDWQAEHSEGRFWLTAENRGNRRLRLSDVAIEAHDGVVHQRAGLVGYVLPGAKMRWPFEADPALAADPSLHLRAMSDTGRIEVPLVDVAEAP